MTERKEGRERGREGGREREKEGKRKRETERGGVEGKLNVNLSDNYNINLPLPGSSFLRVGGNFNS